MRNNHRAHLVTRDDYNQPWKLHVLWRNPNKKFHVMKCGICNPRRPIQVRKVGRIYLEETEPIEKTDWLFTESEDTLLYYDDLGEQ